MSRRECLQAAHPHHQVSKTSTQLGWTEEQGTGVSQRQSVAERDERAPVSCASFSSM